MLPKDATGVRGVRDTADDIAYDKPLDISANIWLYKPYKNQFLNWMMVNQRGDRESVQNHTYQGLEDAPWPLWVEFIGADEAAQGTTSLVFASGNGARLTTGSRVYFPEINEVIRLDAAMSTDTSSTVARNFGRGVAATSLLRKGMRGMILPPSFEQGYTFPSGFSTGRSYRDWYTGIVDWAVEMTGTEVAEVARGGPIFKRELGKAIAASKDQMEAEMVVGGSKSDTTSYTHPITAREGIENWLTSHVYNVKKLSRMDLWDILGEIDVRNGDGLIVSKAFRGLVTSWAMGMTQYQQGTTTDGMTIDTIKTPSRTLDLLEADCLNGHPDMMGRFMVIPKKCWNYLPLIGNGENRDIKYTPEPQNTADKKYGHIHGEFGYEYYEEERWGRAYGLRFAA